MALRGDLGHIAGLKSRLRALPVSIAHDVAQRAAPEMTGLTREAFAGNRSVYGDPRPASRVSGAPLSLTRTGATARELRFVAVGTIVRCVLGPKYAKYLIGKYGVLPNGALPAAWSDRLRAVVAAYTGAP